MLRNVLGLGIVVVVGIAVGCSSGTSTSTTAALPQASEAGEQYLLSSAPADAEDVIDVREHVSDEEDVVVVGRIGGSPNPWVDGLAAFSIVDRSLSACTDIPGDQCQTPWDYCCVTDKLPSATTLVKVVDEQGQVVSTGAQELLGLGELQTVVVQGKASKDEAGNITILASAIYVDSANPGRVTRPGHADDGANARHHDHDHSHDHDNEHHDKDGSEEPHDESKGDS